MPSGNASATTTSRDPERADEIPGRQPGLRRVGADRVGEERYWALGDIGQPSDVTSTSKVNSTRQCDSEVRSSMREHHPTGDVAVALGQPARQRRRGRSGTPSAGVASAIVIVLPFQYCCRTRRTKRSPIDVQRRA